MKTIAMLAMIAGAVALPAGFALAQETADATQGTQMEWQNPERIADIQDESERIRAFSVLIGQSVYDEMLKADDVGNTEEPPQIEAINIIDITEVLAPADVLGLELAAEMNEDNIRRLQDYIELQDDTRAKLEEEDVLPADVVGVQFSEGGVLDILVVPGWLTK